MVSRGMASQNWINDVLGNSDNICIIWTRLFSIEEINILSSLSSSTACTDLMSMYKVFIMLVGSLTTFLLTLPAFLENETTLRSLLVTIDLVVTYWVSMQLATTIAQTDIIVFWIMANKVFILSLCITVWSLALITSNAYKYPAAPSIFYPSLNLGRESKMWVLISECTKCHFIYSASRLRASKQHNVKIPTSSHYKKEGKRSVQVFLLANFILFWIAMPSFYWSKSNYSFCIK